jgi:C4-dicarboxylate-specific signal transduction histidine kinase
VALSLLPSVTSSAAEVILRIEDSGPGFRFDPSDDTLFHSSKAAGTGLGLFVVRTTLANHQGSLELGRSSRLGGAQVSLVLPLLSPSPA